MKREEKRVLWCLIKDNPYSPVKELYNEAIEYIDVSLSTVRKYKRIILEDIKEKEKTNDRTKQNYYRRTMDRISEVAEES